MAVDDVPDLYPTEPVPVRLMNTVWANQDGLQDSLTTVGRLEQWARQCGVPAPARLLSRDVERARSLRDALRRLVAEQLDDDRAGAVSDRLTAGEALDVLNGFLATCAPEVRAGGGSGQGGSPGAETGSGLSLSRGWRSGVGGFERELVMVALEASDLLAEGRPRLGACHGPGCVLYFERVPARREWCSAGCGNRARVARHYRKHKGASDGGVGGGA
ncbi:CGNR zinc finger domain-containing protein [Antribacter gilvus]|uniref:CGNR zinc finger domain-containing protein n=1 Tax=Antribacter gilvus TaxID=2304675 RepID=UPI000F7A12D5|nr:ABATE domain-containing protein [Antribacter gilvus]